MSPSESTPAAAPSLIPLGATQPLVVDVWTDVVCPWCYVGEGRLEQAIQEAGLAGKVQVRTHSFELDPSAPTRAEERAAGQSPTNVEHLMQKTGRGAEEVRGMEEQIAQLARELGRDYALERPVASTRPAHRLLQAVRAAAGEEAAKDFFLSLQRGYFRGELDPFEDEVLVEHAVAAGLHAQAAREVLASDAHDSEVDEEVRAAVEMGARGVPFMVLGDTYAAPGALPVEALRGALEELGRARGLLGEDGAADGPTGIIGGEACGIDGNC
ncbi:DsbA family oxidoreductase [Brachybacterium kimchii]|uniref:DsbA family oxidoreductase n=1 Tax=Brachybacterium kimchii TaxID=2942909 RepID=A0ABY4NA43_9MICO|nr:DsbA family oxidoreductase [Brachybacterium kimchii]UQN31424.1 DsbA family oxidoreductase [Brachybacterium kimchii]